MSIFDDDLMPFDIVASKESIIKVLGVGGGGGNAVNYMFQQGIKDVDFVICNTDAQALKKSAIPIKVQLGSTLTQGLGAGNKPEQGRDAAIESAEEIERILSNNTKMVFITAGMGGGTGTGAAPVIAEIAKKMGILTVGIVTIPFRFEGPRRISQAVEGISQISKHVDSLLIINNEKIREIYGDLTLPEAFGKADNVLTTAAKGIAEIITVPGYVNVDFADVKTVMTNSGIAIMGSGVASGPDRAIIAAQNALNSPLLNSNDIRGAKNILLNIISGKKVVTMDEVSQINEFIQDATGNMADLIWGNTKDDSYEDEISVTVIATGFHSDVVPELYVVKEEEKNKLEDIKVIDTTKNDIDFEVKRKDEDNNLSGGSKTTDNKAFVKDKNSDNDYEKFTLEDSCSSQVQEVKMKTDIEVTDIQETKKDKKDMVDYTSYGTGTTFQKDNEFHFSSSSTNIDVMENVPAFIRHQMLLEETQHSQKNNISRYSLSDDGDEVRINPSNPFLNLNVD